MNIIFKLLDIFRKVVCEQTIAVRLKNKYKFILSLPSPRGANLLISGQFLLASEAPFEGDKRERFGPGSHVLALKFSGFSLQGRECRGRKRLRSIVFLPLEVF